MPNSLNKFIFDNNLMDFIFDLIEDSTMVHFFRYSSQEERNRGTLQE